MDRLATVRLSIPGHEERDVVTDLLFASSEIEPEIVAAAEVLEIIPGISVPVITTGHLLALKVLAGRLQDLADTQALLAHAEPFDIQCAREALVQISERGFHRGKDLQAELAKVLAEADPKAPY